MCIRELPTRTRLLDQTPRRQRRRTSMQGCARNESEKYHLSFQDSKPPEEVEDYIVAYDPDTALTEQLIDVAEEIEKVRSQYEGDNQEQIEKIIDAKEKIREAIDRL